MPLRLNRAQGDPCSTQSQRSWKTTMRRHAGRSVLQVASGNFAAQAAALAAAPVISRMYGPGAYGEYMYVVSLATVLASFANLRLEAAVPLAEDDQTASGLVLSASIAAILVSGIATVSLFALAPLIGWDTGRLWWLPLTAVGISQYNLWSQVALREQMFAEISRRPVMQQVLTPVLQAAGVSWPGGSAGLLAGQLAARFTVVLYMARKAGRKLVRVDVRRLADAVHRFRKFPLIMAPASLLNTLGAYLPIILITHFCGDIFGGYVGLSMQLMMIPSAAVGVAVGQVYMGKIAAAKRERLAVPKGVFMALSGWLCAGALSVLAAGWFVIPALIPTVLGDSWGPVAEVVPIMACPAALGLVSAPMANILVANECTTTIFVLDLVRVGLVGVAGVFTAAMSDEWVHVILAVSASQVVVQVATWLLSYKASAGSIVSAIEGVNK